MLVSFSWYLYSNLSKKQASALEERARDAIDRVLEARPDLLGRKKGSWGDITVEEAVPSADDAAELGEAYGRVVSDEVLDRLDDCRTSISVERDGVNELDPLQVSLLRFLLDSTGPALVDWGDLQIVRSEDVLDELDDFDDAGDLATGLPRPARPRAASASVGAEPTSAADSSGVDRAREVITALETIATDPFVAKRLARGWPSYPEFVRRWVTALQQRGPVADAAAVRELGVDADEFESAAHRFSRFVLELADEIEVEEE